MHASPAMLPTIIVTTSPDYCCVAYSWPSPDCFLSWQWLSSLGRRSGWITLEEMAPDHWHCRRCSRNRLDVSKKGPSWYHKCWDGLLWQGTSSAALEARHAYMYSMCSILFWSTCTTTVAFACWCMVIILSNSVHPKDCYSSWLTAASLPGHSSHNTCKLDCIIIIMGWHVIGTSSTYRTSMGSRYLYWSIFCVIMYHTLSQPCLSTWVHGWFGMLI